MFKKSFSGHNKIWGMHKKVCGSIAPE